MLRLGTAEHDTCTLFVGTAADDISGFTLHRPLNDMRLFEALLMVLKVPGMVLIIPGDAPPLVGHPETPEHLPADMLDALGAPTLVQAAAEILDHIAAAT